MGETYRNRRTQEKVFIKKPNSLGSRESGIAPPKKLPVKRGVGPNG